MHCYAQTDDDEFLRCYFTPRLYTCVGYYNGFGLDLDFEDKIVDGLYLNVNTGLYYSPASYHMVGTEFAIALKYQFTPYLFALFDMQPNMRLQGISHQVNGDYMTFYVRSGLGVGANWDISREHQVYIEAKGCTDIVLLDETHQHNEGIYVIFCVGYKYSFF